MPPWPDRTELGFEEFIATRGTIVHWFGEHRDSLSQIVGIETPDGFFVIKHATSEEAIGWLDSAITFHAAVSHPTIVPILQHVRTRDGLAIVQPWARGQVLVDHFDPAVPARDDPRSPYQRFLRLPVAEITGAIDQLIGAHIAVARAGFVAVDLYDASVIYDFDLHHVSLIDLDMYQRGPYVLQTDRQYGSDAYMAPEEQQRGATIDERTMVYTLGRFALVLLGCGRHDPPDRAHFRGNDQLFEIALHACAPAPDDRLATVGELGRRWRDAIGP